MKSWVFCINYKIADRALDPFIIIYYYFSPAVLYWPLIISYITLLDNVYCTICTFVRQSRTASVKVKSKSFFFPSFPLMQLGMRIRLWFGKGI